MPDNDQVDPGLLAVWNALADRDDLVRLAGSAVRLAIDDVLDTFRTGRYDINGHDVSPQEKAFVGTRFEIRLMAALQLERGNRFDAQIAGQEVDIKFTLGRNWMIPVEAVGEICLLVRANERRSAFTALLGRMRGERLNPGSNRDLKRGLSAALMKEMRVIALDAPLPENVLLHMTTADRSAVLAHAGQENRFAEFFSRRPGTIVGRDLVLSLGRHGDSLKRVRAIKDRMAASGFALLCGSYLDQRELARRLGGPVPGPDEWVSIRCETAGQLEVLATFRPSG